LHRNDDYRCIQSPRRTTLHIIVYIHALNILKRKFRLNFQSASEINKFTITNLVLHSSTPSSSQSSRPHFQRFSCCYMCALMLSLTDRLTVYVVTAGLSQQKWMQCQKRASPVIYALASRNHWLLKQHAASVQFADSCFLQFSSLMIPVSCSFPH